MTWIIILAAHVPVLLWILAEQLFGWSEGDSVWVVLLAFVAFMQAVNKLESWQFQRKSQQIVERDMLEYAVRTARALSEKRESVPAEPA